MHFTIYSCNVYTQLEAKYISRSMGVSRALKEERTLKI